MALIFKKFYTLILFFIFIKFSKQTEKICIGFLTPSLSVIGGVTRVAQALTRELSKKYKVYLLTGPINKNDFPIENRVHREIVYDSFAISKKKLFEIVKKIIFKF